MEPATSKALYKKHQYSGPPKSRKRVRAHLKKHYGEDVSREEIWRKKRKISTVQTKAAENARPGIQRTYSRQKPIKHVEVTFASQKSPQPSTSGNSKTALEINWPVTDPTLESHVLTIEKSTQNHMNGLSGNRIVEIQHVLRWAFALEKHRQSCASSVIEFVAEERSGFVSTFTFKCSMCDLEFRETNVSGDGDKLNLHGRV